MDAARDDTREVERALARETARCEVVRCEVVELVAWELAC